MGQLAAGAPGAGAAGSQAAQATAAAQLMQQQQQTQPMTTVGVTQSICTPIQVSSPTGPGGLQNAYSSQAAAQSQKMLALPPAFSCLPGTPTGAASNTGTQQQQAVAAAAAAASQQATLAQQLNMAQQYLVQQQLTAASLPGQMAGLPIYPNTTGPTVPHPAANSTATTAANGFPAALAAALAATNGGGPPNNQAAVHQAAAAAAAAAAAGGNPYLPAPGGLGPGQNPHHHSASIHKLLIPPTKVRVTICVSL